MGYEKSKTGSNRERKGQAGSADTAKGLAFGDYRICRIELSASERDACRAAVGEREADFTGIDAYVGGGYAVKFSTDKRGGGIQVSVTCHDVANGDAGLILIARGASAAIAWDVFLYKSLVICQDRTWRQAEHERGGSYRDID